MENLREEDPALDEDEDDSPRDYDDFDETPPAQWKSLKEILGSQLQGQQSPDKQLSPKSDDGEGIGTDAARKLDLMIRCGQIDPSSGIMLKIPSLESPASRDRRSPAPFSSSVSQGTSTSVSRKLSLLHTSLGQPRPGSRRVSLAHNQGAISPSPSRRTSTMYYAQDNAPSRRTSTSVNLSGHMLRIDSRDQGSSRRTSLAQAHSASNSRRSSFISAAPSDRKGSVLDIAEVSRRVQRAIGTTDRSAVSPAPTLMTFALQPAINDSSSDEEDELIHEGIMPKILDENVMLSRKSVVATGMDTAKAAPGEKRATLKLQKQKRLKGNASKEVVNTVVDARAMAMRQAALIKEWIQDAADEASKCHEKWLSRRKKLREEHHRISLSVKSEERIEADTRKITQRLRRKRKTGIATRLLGATSPRSSFLGTSFNTVSPRTSFNTGQISPLQATTSNDATFCRNLGAPFPNSTTPSAELVSTMSSPSDEVGRSMSDFRKHALAVSTTPDSEYTSEKFNNKLTSRPQSTPSTQTGGMRSASSSSVGMRTEVSPAPRLGSDCKSVSPLTSAEFGSPVGKFSAFDDVLPSGFVHSHDFPCSMLNNSMSHWSDDEDCDDEVVARNSKAPSLATTMKEHKHTGPSGDALELRDCASDEQCRPSSQRCRRGTKVIGGRNKIRSSDIKFSPEARLNDVDYETDDELDGLGMISELEVSHMAKPGRSLPPLVDSEDNTEAPSSPRYRPEKLPEVPRLRSKYKDYRYILSDRWRNEACTVKRFHTRVAEQLGLEEDDWSWMGSIYCVSVGDLERAAELKDQKEHVEAARTVQQRWRALRLYRVTMNMCRQRLYARRTIQKWWRHYYKFRLPMRNRLRGRPAFLRALLRIQAFARGRVVRYHVALRKQLHSVTWRMQCLKVALGGFEVADVVRAQAFIRGFLARRRVQLLRNKASVAKRAALEAAMRESKEKSRRVSLIRFPTPHVLRGNEVKTRGRRASEVISVRPFTFKNDSAFARLPSPCSFAKVQEDPATSSSPGSSSSESEGLSDVEPTPSVTAIPECAGTRATNSTPLGRRLKRPLDAEVARMGGLQKYHGNIAEMVRRQSKKKTTRTKIGSFTLPTLNQLPDKQETETQHHVANIVAKITIPVPKKGLHLGPVKKRTLVNRNAGK